MSANDGQDATRLLPAPDHNENAAKVEVNSDKTLKFDTLGPMVVNSDGVSRHLGASVRVRSTD